MKRLKKLGLTDAYNNDDTTQVVFWCLLSLPLLPSGVPGRRPWRRWTRPQRLNWSSFAVMLNGSGLLKPAWVRRDCQYVTTRRALIMQSTASMQRSVAEIERTSRGLAIRRAKMSSTMHEIWHRRLHMAAVLACRQSQWGVHTAMPCVNSLPILTLMSVLTTTQVWRMETNRRNHRPRNQLLSQTTVVKFVWWRIVTRDWRLCSAGISVSARRVLRRLQRKVADAPSVVPPLLWFRACSDWTNVCDDTSFLRQLF